MTGSGKSSVINILLGQKKCETGQTFGASGITPMITDYKMRDPTEIEIGKH